MILRLDLKLIDQLFFLDLVFMVQKMEMEIIQMDGLK